MPLADIAKKFQSGLEKRPIDNRIKFDCSEAGAISIVDGQAHLADMDADCTIHISESNLEKLIAGKLNPMTGFAMGKIRVSGDMTLAMKLSQLLG